MRNIRDILRLKLAGGLSIRQIKASTKVSVCTIQKLLSKANDLGLTWPLPESLDDNVYTKEMVGQLTAISISGHQVARFLDLVSEERQLPQVITCDNGTEYTSKAMFFWCKKANVKLGFIQPGKPTQNAFIESLNGKFRNECLNQHWFRSLEEARSEIDQWREHYNNVRPHSSLGYMPPVEFAKKAA